MTKEGVSSKRSAADGGAKVIGAQSLPLSEAPAQSGVIGVHYCTDSNTLSDSQYCIIKQRMS